MQFLCVLVHHKNKSWAVKAKELAITLLFLRGPVDAYRVGANILDEQETYDPLLFMQMNKCSEMVFER